MSINIELWDGNFNGIFSMTTILEAVDGVATNLDHLEVLRLLWMSLENQILPHLNQCSNVTNDLRRGKVVLLPGSQDSWQSSIWVCADFNTPQNDTWKLRSKIDHKTWFLWAVAHCCMCPCVRSWAWGSRHCNDVSHCKDQVTLIYTRVYKPYVQIHHMTVWTETWLHWYPCLLTHPSLPPLRSSLRVEFLSHSHTVIHANVSWANDVL